MVIAEMVLGIVMIVSIVAGITINRYLNLLRDNQSRLGDLDRELGRRLERIDSWRSVSRCWSASSPTAAPT